MPTNSVVMASASFERPMQVTAVFDLKAEKVHLTLGDEPQITCGLTKNVGHLGMVTYDYKREYEDGSHWSIALTRVAGDEFVEHHVYTNKHSDKDNPHHDPRNWKRIAKWSHMPSTNSKAYMTTLGTRMTVEVSREDGTTWTP